MKKNLLFTISLIFLLNFNTLSQEKENNSYKIKFSQQNPSEFLLELTIKNYNISAVNKSNMTYSKLNFEGNVTTMKKGWAELPVIGVPVQLSPDKNVSFEIVESEYTETNLTYPMLPSRGVIMRNQDPSQIPYEIDPASVNNSWYPAENYKNTKPYIIRDIRGENIYFTPFQYNAAQNKLKVCTKLTLRVYEDNTPAVNPITNPHSKIAHEMAAVYNSMFINYNQNPTRWTQELGEFGEILVIYTSRDATAIQPWITWKMEKGFKVTEVEVSTGTNIVSTVATEYANNNNILYVQLVGDWADIKCDMGSSGNAPTDPDVGCVVGSDDYHDLIVGRFSANSAADVTVQGNKTITYERDPETNGTWYAQSLGIGSDQGPGDDNEYDYQQIDNIHDGRLLNFTYTTCNEVYDPGATASQVANYINSGVSVINYCGHGAHDYWVTSTYSTSNANSATNGNKLPYVFSVACVVGEFYTGSDCLAEALLKKDGGGAVATWMSTINQPWEPPMRGQDYANDLLTQGYDYTSNPGNGISTTYGKTTFGSIVFNAGALMLAESSTSSDLDTYKTWSIFGDANLQCRTKAPDAITLSNEIVTPGTFTTTVSVGGTPFEGAIVSLYKSGDPQPYSAVTDASGTVSITNPYTGGETVKLTVTGFNLNTYYQDKVVGSSSTLIANFSGTPLVIPEGGTVDFTDLSSGSPTSWSWSFSGGTPATSTAQSPSGIQYNTSGFYDVTLTISDGTNNHSETKTHYIQVNGPLNADFEGIPTTLLAGNTVDFTDLSTGGSSITNWDWTFTGGTPATSTNQNPTGIQYNTPGLYEVTLTVTDDNSTTDTETKTNYIEVLDPNALMADFNADVTTIVQGGTVNFYDQSQNGPPTSWSWEFPGAVTTISSVQNPTAIQYDNVGTYTVRLTVSDGTVTSDAEKIDYINVIDSSMAAHADFASDYTTVVVGGSINFFDLSAGNPTAWEWTFTGADVTSSTDQDPATITYSNVGIYPVTLKITTAVGNDSITKIDYIHVIDNSSLGQLFCDFKARGSRLITQGSTVSFEDLTVGYPTNWEWTFQGGVPATEIVQHPFDITYNSPGFYDVQLIVSNGIAADTLKKENFIIVTDQPWQNPNGYCDSISNIMTGEFPLCFRSLNPAKWGYFPGHNGYTIRAYAEKYTNYTFSNVQGILVPPVKAYSASSSGKVRFTVWDIDSLTGMPGAELTHKDVLISNFSPYIYHSVMFDSPVDIDGTFFAGFQLYYSTPQDTFVVYMTPDRGINGLNTLYVKKGTWQTPSSVLGDSLNTSMAIDLIGCLVEKDEISLDNNILVYPNPTSDVIFIEFTDQRSAYVEVYDIFGRKIIYQEMPNEKRIKLNLSDQSNGMYLLKINADNNSVIKKITLVH